MRTLGKERGIEGGFLAPLLGVAAAVYFQTDLFPRGCWLGVAWLGDGECSVAENGDIQFFCWASATIGSTGAGKTEPQEQQQLGTAVHPMFATMEVPESVESFDGQGQHGEKPADQQTVGVMMTDVLEAVTTLGVVEALVLDLPAALGHAE
jgi:hypothetical protein